MKILYLLLLLTFLVNAQTLKEVNMNMRNAFSLGDYKAAFDFAKQAVDMSEKEFGRDSNYAAAVNNLATMYMRRFYYFDALEHYNLTLRVKDEIGKNNDYSYASTLINLGDLYRLRGLPDSAYLYYLKAGEIDKAERGADSDEYGSALINTGVMAFVMGNYNEAELKLMEAKEIREKRGMFNTLSYGALLVHIGNVLRAKGEYVRAEDYFRTAVARLSHITGNISKLYINAEKQFGELLIDMGKLMQADSALGKARYYLKTSFKETDPEYTELQILSAELFLKMGRLSKAAETAEEAFEIRKKIYRPFHPAFLNSVFVLAKVYYTQERFEEAFDLLTNFFENSLNMREIYYPSMSLDARVSFFKDYNSAISIYASLAERLIKDNGKKGELILSNFFIGNSINPVNKEKFEDPFMYSYIFNDSKNKSISDWLKLADRTGRIAMLTNEALSKWGENLDSLINVVLKERDEIGKTQPEFAAYFKNFQKSWKDFRDSADHETSIFYLVKFPADPGSLISVYKIGAVTMQIKGKNPPMYREIAVVNNENEISQEMVLKIAAEVKSFSKDAINFNFAGNDENLVEKVKEILFKQ